MKIRADAKKNPIDVNGSRRIILAYASAVHTIKETSATNSNKSIQISLQTPTTTMH